MKKSIMMLMVAISLIAMSSQAFAASYGKSAGASYMVVEGTIVSIDKAKNIFAVKDKDDGKVYGLLAWTVDITPFNQGESVKVTVPLPGGIVSKITR